MVEIAVGLVALAVPIPFFYYVGLAVDKALSAPDKPQEDFGTRVLIGMWVALVLSLFLLAAYYVGAWIL